MSAHGSYGARRAALRAGITELESRIRHRQTEMGTALRTAVRGVNHNLRSRLVSPGTILSAGLLGAALQQDHRLRGLRMLAILQTADAALRLLLTATSRARL